MEDEQMNGPDFEFVLWIFSDSNEHKEPVTKACTAEQLKEQIRTILIRDREAKIFVLKHVGTYFVRDAIIGNDAEKKHRSIEPLEGLLEHTKQITEEEKCLTEK